MKYLLASEEVLSAAFSFVYEEIKYNLMCPNQNAAQTPNIKVAKNAP
jgi:hypothetical protein